MSRATSYFMHVLPMVGFAFCVVLGIWGVHSGVLTSQEAMQELIAGVGIWAPIIFLTFQAVQVVVPILPGSIGCLVGVIVFGPIWGFVYNYVGICIGSMLAFAVAKMYGRPLLPKLFRQSTIDKYDRWMTEKGRFDFWFAVAIFLPVAPDDFLCYLAGTTKMRAEVFLAVILLGKPLSIAAYSMGLNVIFRFLIQAG